MSRTTEALAGDTIDAIATARGLANALIEIRQGPDRREARNAIAWAERLARVFAADHRRSAVRRTTPRSWQIAPMGDGSSSGKTLFRNLTRSEVKERSVALQETELRSRNEHGESTGDGYD